MRNRRVFHSPAAVALLVFAGSAGCAVETEDEVEAGEAELMIGIPDMDVTLQSAKIIPTYGGYQTEAKFKIANIGTATAKSVEGTYTMVTTPLGGGWTTSPPSAIASLPETIKAGQSVDITVLCPKSAAAFTICNLAKVQVTAEVDLDPSNNVDAWSSWTCPEGPEGNPVRIECQPSKMEPNPACIPGEYRWWVTRYCDVFFTY